MAYVYVPRDLSRVKHKVLFNLTWRQIICFGSAAALGIPTYLLTRGFLGNNFAALAMIALMLPCFLFALYEKNGQSAEVILRNVIRVKFTAPKRRLYKTTNIKSQKTTQRQGG